MVFLFITLLVEGWREVIFNTIVDVTYGRLAANQHTLVTLSPGFPAFHIYVTVARENIISTQNSYCT